MLWSRRSRLTLDESLRKTSELSRRVSDDDRLSKARSSSVANAIVLVLLRTVRRMRTTFASVVCHEWPVAVQTAVSVPCPSEPCPLVDKACLNAGSTGDDTGPQNAGTGNGEDPRGCRRERAKSFHGRSCFACRKKTWQTTAVRLGRGGRVRRITPVYYRCSLGEGRARKSAGQVQQVSGTPSRMLR